MEKEGKLAEDVAALLDEIKEEFTKGIRAASQGDETILRWLRISLTTGLFLANKIRDIFSCYGLRDGLIVMGLYFGRASLRDLQEVFKLDHSTISKIYKGFIEEEAKKQEAFLSGKSAKPSKKPSITKEGMSGKTKRKSPCRKCKKIENCTGTCPDLEKLLPSMDEGRVILFEDDKSTTETTEEQIERKFFDRNEFVRDHFGKDERY